MEKGRKVQNKEDRRREGGNGEMDKASKGTELISSLLATEVQFLVGCLFGAHGTLHSVTFGPEGAN